MIFFLKCLFKKLFKRKIQSLNKNPYSDDNLSFIEKKNKKTTKILQQDKDYSIYETKLHIRESRKSI
jgi:hypothetical protein